MPIPGIQFEQITDAFEAAYDRDDLRDMLKKRLSEKLDNMTGPNSKWPTTVFDLVTWFERRGRTTELIRAGYNYNPTHPSMQEIYQKYGMGTEVSLQQGGQTTAALTITDSGFERTVRPHIPQLNFGAFREKMSQVEGRICRIEIGGNAAGTGFLIGPDAVLTNYHVLEEILAGDTKPTGVACRFDYKVLSDKSRLEGIVAQLHPTDWKLDASPYSPAEKTRNPDNPPPASDQLDYALVRIARRLGEEPFTPGGGAEAQKRGWLSMPAGPLTFVKDMPLIIGQHPDGSPLKVAFDTQSVIGEVANGLRVRYRTNTEAGSSGSPVFDLDWKLVALHHMGDPACDLPPTYNQGIPIDKIRAQLLKTVKAAEALGS